MDDNAYNRHIANMVKAINMRYISDAEAKRQISEDMPITTNSLGGRRMRMKKGAGLLSGILKEVQGVGSRLGGVSTGGVSTGGGFLDDLATGFKLPFQVVSKLTGGKKKKAGAAVTGGKRGRPRKMDKMDKMSGAGFLDDVLGTVSGVAKFAPLLGLGKKGRKMGMGNALDNRDSTFATPVAVGNMPVAGRRRRMRKAGAITTGGKMRKTGGNMLGARAVGSGYSELEGSGFFDDVLEGVSNVGKLVDKGVNIGEKLGLLKKGKGKGMNKMTGKKKMGGVSTGGKMKMAGVSTGGKKKMAGVSTGGKRGASNWIMFVKEYAKKHNMKYNEALKDPKLKSAYRSK